MRETPFQAFKSLIILIHEALRPLVTALNGLIFAMSFAGICFILTMLPLTQCLSNPMDILPTAKAFVVNSVELSKPALSTTTQATTEADSTWDGALAGMSIGFALTRHIPIVGEAIGLTLGAWMGYQLDDGT